MRNKAVASMKIKKLDDLFGIEVNEVQDIPVENLYEFHSHPYRVVEDEDMENLIDSIKQFGVLVPGLCRKRKDGGYEIISGHRRKYASIKAGKDTMPMIVRDLDDDEAVIQMVDSNLQREELLVSEKAKAYSMRYRAMKHKGGNSLEVLSEESGDSPKTIQRLIYISRLIDDLLELVDNKKLGLTQAYDLSFLEVYEQEMVFDLIQSNEIMVPISIKQSAGIKEYAQKKELTSDILREILIGKEENKVPVRKVSLSYKKLSEFFDDSYSPKEIENILFSLLEQWKKGEK